MKNKRVNRLAEGTAHEKLCGSLVFADPSVELGACFRRSPGVKARTEISPKGFQPLGGVLCVGE